MLALSRAVALLGVAAASMAVAAAQPALSIEAFGAVPWASDWQTSINNGRALYNAMMAANSGMNGTRTVLVPSGKNFTMLPWAPMLNLQSVTLQIDGAVIANTQNFTAWPSNPYVSNSAKDASALDLFFFANATDLRLTGSGLVDGDGYQWWWYCLLGGFDNRPVLYTVYHSTGLTIDGSLTFVNSPRYHFFIYDVLNVDITGLHIWVDVVAQQAMLRERGFLASPARAALVGEGPDGKPAWHSVSEEQAAALVGKHPALQAADASALSALTTFSIPTFPLNTDGIDIAGRNVHVWNVTVENFDDALCVKPLNRGDGIVTGGCAQDYVFEDSLVYAGVGLTIGSVPPNTNHACVRNVTFQRITQVAPIKGIYVKPNPGNNGDGEITDITYRDINMTNALWWSIWVGTQQQKQPGNGSGTDCSFFYPLPNTSCPVQPRVPVRGLVLQNVHSSRPLLSPGVLTCPDAPNAPYGPCDGWVFENVVMNNSITHWPNGDGYFCLGVDNGSWIDGTYPVPDCV